MTDNVAESIIVSEQEVPINVAGEDVAGEGEVKSKRGRPRNLVPREYWGKDAYFNVCLHLDKSLSTSLKIMAIREQTTVSKLASEAIAAWMKWLAKAERDEAVGEEKEAAERRFREAADLLYALRNKNIKTSLMVRMEVKKREKLEKALKSRKSWHRIYPDKPWPGVGKQPERLATYRAEQEEKSNLTT